MLIIYIWEKYYKRVKPFSVVAVKKAKYTDMNKAHLPESNKLHRFRFRVFVRNLVFLFILFLATYSLQAQTTENPKGIDKSKLTIKPNSRDVNVSFRNNLMLRVHKFRKPDSRAMHPIRKKQLQKKNINPAKKQEMMQRRKQIMQQRRALRK